MASKFGDLQIPLEHILKATDNFSDVNIIGRGGFGPAYKGQLSPFGNVVALRLDRRLGLGGLEFWNEISLLSDLNHPNLVSLIGFCHEKREKIIVIRHEAKGSLAEHLNTSTLTWTLRLKLALGVARALAYLYHDQGRGYGVIHRNLNSYTILLDENWEPKLSGFIFAIKQPVNRMDQVILREPIGIPGYVDPVMTNSITMGVTHKSDVYSFGVVLFEIFCGRKAFIDGEEEELAPLAIRCYEENELMTKIHRDLWKYQMSVTSLNMYAKAAYLCIKEDPIHRPSIVNTMGNLEKALEFQLSRENLVNNLESLKIEHLKISLKDIELATNGFSETCSGHPTLYRAELDLSDKENPSSVEAENKGKRPKGRITAVIKRYTLEHHLFEEKAFLSTEIQMLTRIKHPNIVTLLGFCVEGVEMILVIENISNEFLGDYLNNKDKLRVLTLEKRLNICIDVARALRYLHYELGDQKMMINRSIYCDNIGLDENGRAKIVDFMFSVFLSQGHEEEAPFPDLTGKEVYMDLEYEKTRKLKRELNVYSFGVVVLEILCGRTANDPIYLKESDKGLAYVARRSHKNGTLEDMIDPLIKEESGENSFVHHKDSLRVFMEVAVQCVTETQDQRPTMKDIVTKLEKALVFEEDKVQSQDVDQVVIEPEKPFALQFTQENIAEGSNTSQVVDKPEKALDLLLAQEIPGKNLEHLKIRLADIQLATNNFSSKYEIGSDVCYTCYRAQLPRFNDQTPSSVVIKHISPRKEFYQERHFVREIEVLTRVKHPNIVTLLGFCVEDSEMILVFENFANGYLGDYLEDSKKLFKKNNTILTWEKRLKICVQIASALSYLHSGIEDQSMIVNRDVHSPNIGLDENWEAKIASFEYSMFLTPNKKDEAYKFKREFDIFSFGEIMFEILCGRAAHDPIYLKEGHKGLAYIASRSFCNGTLEEMIDPIIKEETDDDNFVLSKGPNKGSLQAFAEIAYQCVEKTQDQHLTMEVVVKKLEKALLFQEYNMDNRKISLADLKRATQNFHDDYCVGKGGFGKVYKGDLQDGNTIVAKRLNTRFGQGEQQFLCELQILLEYKHENVIGLIGYCDEEDEKIIVYEYASRGSLDSYLNDVSLTWVERVNICIDVASALDFIHGGIGKKAKVIHRDIKSANILLQHDWKAKLGDFGLSLISPIIQETDYVIDRTCGTPGYFDPLYKESGFLTVESDIYSFGVVLFEILCGRSTYSIYKKQGEYLSSFIKKKFEEGKCDEMVLKQIKEQIEPKSLATFQKIAYRCLHHEREKRPSAKKVLTELKKALEFQNLGSTMIKLNPLKIPLEDIAKATNNFHDDNIIRRTGFHIAYKGQLLQSTRLMEIAAMRFDFEHGEEDHLRFYNEISMLSDLNHPNVVSIVGFVDEKDEKIMVTTYEANESIGQYLNSPNLTWTQRLRICVSTARALSYLYDDDNGRGYAIIHGNINSDTILLDDNLEPRLSGFGNSIKQYKDNPVTGGVTHNSDVYSFGVVLFEILCGRKANEANSFLAPLAKHHYERRTLDEIIHPDLVMSPQSFLKYSAIAYSCLYEDQTQRPSINQILHELEEALQLQLPFQDIEEKNLKHLNIHLTHIRSATDNFADTYRIIYGGSFANFRAELEHFEKQNPSTVVIKRITPGTKSYLEFHFLLEIEIFTRFKHPNIISLFGFCVEASEMILIFENISNGYLGDYLGNDDKLRILTWEKRLKICIDVAKALSYLHYEMEDNMMIINRDICSYNIGLDENWQAKILNFEYSVLLPQSQEDEGLYPGRVGRATYIDPEYAETTELNKKSDVYSFGVVLLEMLCGRLSFDPIFKKESHRGLAPLARQSFYTGTLVEMMDPVIKEETGENNFVLNRGPNKDSLHTFIEIALECVAETQDQRPTMKIALKKLEKALFLQENRKDNPKIPLENIKLATQNFHEDNCIGGEGFKKVYKGSLQVGDRVNSTIAAKRLDTRFGLVEKHFSNELQILWEFKHENVIELVGYCDEHDERIIVYEYESGRSLDRYLNDTSLTWMKRLCICIDVARALDFIHGGAGKKAKVVHGNIETTNILLDVDWKAKLAGFGRSLLCPVTHETEYVIDYECGTPAYRDPLYDTSGLLTIESDIYSFGVVLFEILCGRSTLAVLEHEGHYLPEFIKNKFDKGKHEEVVLEQIREEIVPESLTVFQEVAYRCLHHEREKRPETEEVLTQLELALAFQISKG